MDEKTEVPQREIKSIKTKTKWKNITSKKKFFFSLNSWMEMTEENIKELEDI